MRIPVLASFMLVPLVSCSAPAILGQRSGLPAFYDPGPDQGSEADPLPKSVEDARPLVDWGVVEGAEPGVPEVAAPTHGVEPTEPGRLYILELYQSVLDERDALQIELAALSGELEHARERISRLEAEKQTAENRVDELESDVALLREETRDLGGRLTTAQIRRLEAEKLLLETRITWQRKVLEDEEQRSGVRLRGKDGAAPEDGQ